MSKKKTPSLFMESTDIPAQRTIAEIHSTLVMSGLATAIRSSYAGREVAGLSFSIQPAQGPPITFELPVRTEAVYETLYKRRAKVDEAAKQAIRRQAERVAWRQLLRWIQAQLAMVEAGMAQPHEVFMPYDSPAASLPKSSLRSPSRSPRSPSTAGWRMATRSSR